jgi:hypothetical protein
MNESLLVLILFAAVLALIALGIAVGLFLWLWNMTMPQVFGLKTVTFWQAFRLLLMAGILFNGVAILRISLSLGLAGFK